MGFCQINEGELIAESQKKKPAGTSPSGGGAKGKGGPAKKGAKPGSPSGNRGGGGGRGRPGGRGRGRGRGRGGRGRFGNKRPEKKVNEDGEAKSVEIEGTVSAVLAGTMFKVKLPSGHEVLAHISGKMRKRFIRLVIGDKVKMEMSPYDTSKARIVYRVG
ncbi:MAG: translation initiation factor IF-1 [Verrucomicrobiota bacterium JB023]|nr:translation initiation factor IF-1 [Verrucomicrobiota bacterium JB023]